MAQDPRQQYAQMLSALPPNALERIKKEMRRRALLFGLGAVITIVGASRRARASIRPEPWTTNTSTRCSFKDCSNCKLVTLRLGKQRSSSSY